MKNILVTQRSEYLALRDEYRDCLDQQFAKLFSKSFNVIPVSNKNADPQYFAESLNCGGIILSGGNTINPFSSDADSRRFNLEQSLLDYARSKFLPVVGICYGMQRLNVYCGGSVQKCLDHVGDNHEVFFNEIKIKVNSFHENCISEENLSTSFKALGRCADATIECVLHKKLPWLGIMWHPERKIPNQNIWIDILKKIFISSERVSSESIQCIIDENLKGQSIF